MMRKNSIERSKPINTATLYRVSKFVPSGCVNPECLQEFDTNDDKGYLLLLYWKGGQEISDKIMQQMKAPFTCDLIVCGKCHNITLRVMIEERDYIRQEDALLALREGFTQLIEVKYVGSLDFKVMRRTVYGNQGLMIEKL